MTLRTLKILFITFWLLAIVQPAAAHGYIVRSVPEDRAVLERSPTRVQYWFSESLEPDFSSINVRDRSGEIIATGGVADENTTLLRVQLPPNLPDGAYVVELRPAFASDGHVNAESRVFFVGEAVGGVEGQAASGQAVPLEVIWRAVLLAASMLAFGTATLYTTILVPAWGSKEHRAGLLPPRVMAQLTKMMGAALALALVANLVALIQQTMTFFSVDVVRAFDPTLWNVVRIGSRFGDIWNFRMIMLVIAAGMLAASLYYRKSQPAAVRAFWTANLWALALVLGTFSVVSHAAGSLLWPWIGITVDWLHGIAVGFWVGGLMALVLVLPTALRPYTGETRRAALVAVLHHFSRTAAACVGLVITTGIYSALNWITTPADAAQTPFGGALIFKILLVVLLLAFGAVNHVAVRADQYPRLAKSLANLGDFATRLRLEMIVALFVLTAAGLVTATPVPVPEFTREQQPAPSAVQQIGDTEIAVTLSPGGPGINSYDVLIARGGQPVDNAQTWVQQINPSRDTRGIWNSADPVENGVYVGSDADIDKPGVWWTVVDVQPPDGQMLRAAFAWEISQDAAVIESRPPTLANFAALLAVLAAVGWALYPLGRRLVNQLDLSPTMVTIALGAAAATVLLLIFGTLFVQESERQYQEATNPPPQIVNTILPDAESLRQGEQLYTAHCSGWDEGISELRERLPRTDDEELFGFTRTGWRTLPPCAGDLTETQLWHLVNYIRTFERRGL